ncbi:hypothetical protein [Actinomadura madurae]|uniref:hypothetical protein n=1 Tax=Actinomadura madurae TaxID=1993 RepID=UPI0020D2276F|nr:hypothetical protein [Actinomadura madurae]MCP9952760.1 hypothetical protein [Actinomadura madurae]MCP9981977.1 hypothetical protein [Actinomadura madurae]MCQ0006492.1 hypothetical protein [Actinomadura madurae]MCQ0018216.1 hypothetical protein [Actinomadura madurae]
MTQMLEGPPATGPALPPETQWTAPDQQWTDWGRTRAPAGAPRPNRKFFRAPVIVPLAVLTGLFVLGGLFLLIAAPAGAAGVCGGG